MTISTLQLASEGDRPLFQSLRATVIVSSYFLGPGRTKNLAKFYKWRLLRSSTVPIKFGRNRL